MMLGGLEEANLAIFAEPYDSDGYFLSVHAPEPGDGGADLWDIEIGRWEPDDPDEDAECSSATGGTVLRCVLPTSPDAVEIADLLNQVGNDPDLLAKWAKTRVGVALAGDAVCRYQGL